VLPQLRSQEQKIKTFFVFFGLLKRQYLLSSRHMLPRATAVGAPTAAQYLSQKKKDARATAALQKKKKLRAR
jgi:hypothetical protein